MAQYTKEELHDYLQLDFIENPKAFSPGRRNDDMVDSMCICFALDEEWTEMYAKWVDNNLSSDGLIRGWFPDYYFEHFIRDHYERVKKWLEGKEANGYNRGESDIMDYSINY